MNLPDSVNAKLQLSQKHYCCSYASLSTLHMLSFGSKGKQAFLNVSLADFLLIPIQIKPEGCSFLLKLLIVLCIWFKPYCYHGGILKALKFLPSMIKSLGIDGLRGGKPYAEKSEMSVAKFDFLRLCIGLLIKKVSFPEMAICTIPIYKTCCNGEAGEGICTLWFSIYI